MSVLLALPLFMLIALIVGVTYFVGKLQAWKDLPTQASFVEKHPDQSCPKCQSLERSDKGLWGVESLERIFACAQCHTKLYRNELTDD